MKKSKQQNLKSKPRKSFAKKSLGQNFLADQNYVDKIIAAVDPKQDETVIEIGPGRGALTRKLVEFAGKVIAIEIDRELIPLLREEFSSKERFVLIEKDALEVDFASLVALQGVPAKTKLVANLPYYISTAILQRLIQYRNSFSYLVLMLQKEVVERITAKPGTKKRGFLTVLIEAYFDTEKLFDVSPNAFHPIPKVTSSVVRLVPKKSGFTGPKESEILFREIISAGFAQKRKTIQNNLKNISGELAERLEVRGGVARLFEEVSVDRQKRAESLTLQEWKQIANYLA